jgi:hypothetical protein
VRSLSLLMHEGVVVPGHTPAHTSLTPGGRHLQAPSECEQRSRPRLRKRGRCLDFLEGVGALRAGLLQVGRRCAGLAATCPAARPARAAWLAAPARRCVVARWWRVRVGAPVGGLRLGSTRAARRSASLERWARLDQRTDHFTE